MTPSRWIIIDHWSFILGKNTICLLYRSFAYGNGKNSMDLCSSFSLMDFCQTFLLLLSIHKLPVQRFPESSIVSPKNETCFKNKHSCHPDMITLPEGMGITYTHEIGSLVHKDHLSTPGITCTHGMRSLVHMDAFMG